MVISTAGRPRATPTADRKGQKTEGLIPQQGETQGKAALTSEAKKRAIRRKLCDNCLESKDAHLERNRKPETSSISCNLLSPVLLGSPPPPRSHPDSAEVPFSRDTHLPILRSTAVFKLTKPPGYLLPQPTRGPPSSRPQPSRTPLAAASLLCIPMGAPNVWFLPPGFPR